MNTQLPASLPEHKLKEIEAIKQVIAEFVDPDMIILYGSYARGEHKDQIYVYFGDAGAGISESLGQLFR